MTTALTPFLRAASAADMLAPRLKASGYGTGMGKQLSWQAVSSICSKGKCGSAKLRAKDPSLHLLETTWRSSDSKMHLPEKVEARAPGKF